MSIPIDIGIGIGIGLTNLIGLGLKTAIHTLTGGCRFLNLYRELLG